MRIVNQKNPLPRSFFTRDVLDVAPELLGKNLCCIHNEKIHKYLITETEAYRGEEDFACHANKGRTKRTEVMYHIGGKVYIYLIYGMYYMLNIVTGKINNPQAVLIRGIEEYNGPGKLTKALHIDKTYYGEDIVKSTRIWIEEGKPNSEYSCAPRIGIDYAGDIWKNKPWRFTLIKKLVDY